MTQNYIKKSSLATLQPLVKENLNTNDYLPSSNQNEEYNLKIKLFKESKDTDQKHIINRAHKEWEVVW